MFRDLYETEAALKLVFIAKAYKVGIDNIWNKLNLTQDWIHLLRKERQLLSRINKVPPTGLTWLNLVNLYGYLIGEQVFIQRESGFSEALSKLPGNHPYSFVLATLKGFDKAIMRKGSLASYYATYAIEGVCTFSYVTLRNQEIGDKLRRCLLQELKHRLADTQSDVVLRENEALRQFHLMEEALKCINSVTLDEKNICLVLERVKEIVSCILPRINKWVYLTFAETNKEHDQAVTRMSTRFTHAVLVSPDFEVNKKGEIRAEALPVFKLIMDGLSCMMNPKEEILDFVETSVLPKIRSEDCKELVGKFLCELR